MSDVTLPDLLEAGAHFGHQTRYWNPKMSKYIYGVYHKIHIIDLDKTLQLYKDALNFVSSLVAKKGKVLFVGTKNAAQDIIAEEATRCGMPYVNYRWLGGMLTNYKTIRQSIKKLKELEELRDSPAFNKFTKKEALMMMRELEKLEKALGGIKNMGGLPDALFVIDIGYEKTAITEAQKLRIPIIGIVDTNCSPDGIDYVIPGNDDSARAIKLYVKNMADIIIDSRGTVVEEQEIERKDEEQKTATKKPIKPKKKVVTQKPVVIKKEEAITAALEETEAKNASEENAEKKSKAKINKPKVVKKTKTKSDEETEIASESTGEEA